MWLPESEERKILDESIKTLYELISYDEWDKMKISEILRYRRGLVALEEVTTNYRMLLEEVLHKQHRLAVFR